jgi:hypothetical protein
LISTLAGACSGRTDPQLHPDPVPAVRTFEARVAEYVKLHRELEAKLPKLGDAATPEEIDTHQRALGAEIRAARPGARRGDLFTPEMQAFLARIFERVFQGENGKNLLGSIMDENPGIPELVVNERYPDAVPLSTMPPEILSELPALEEDMEYRFIGRRLALIDAHAHTIVDFTDELLPS